MSASSVARFVPNFTPPIRRAPDVTRLRDSDIEPDYYLRAAQLIARHPLPTGRATPRQLNAAAKLIATGTLATPEALYPKLHALEHGVDALLSLLVDLDFDIVSKRAFVSGRTHGVQEEYLLTNTERTVLVRVRTERDTLAGADVFFRPSVENASLEKHALDVSVPVSTLSASLRRVTEAQPLVPLWTGAFSHENLPPEVQAVE